MRGSQAPVAEGLREAIGPFVEPDIEFRSPRALRRAGATFTFSVDLDPTTIKGTEAPGPAESGSVSGLEMVGSSVDIVFGDDEERSGVLFAVAASDSEARAHVAYALPEGPGLDVAGQTSGSTTDTAEQTVAVSGAAGSTVRLAVLEGGLFLPSQDEILVDGVTAPDRDALGPNLINSLVAVRHYEAVIGSDGTVDMEVLLSNTGDDAGINTIVGAVLGEDGETGAVSSPYVLGLSWPTHGQAPRCADAPRGLLRVSRLHESPPETMRFRRRRASSTMAGCCERPHGWPASVARWSMGGSISARPSTCRGSFTGAGRAANSSSSKKAATPVATGCA